MKRGIVINQSSNLKNLEREEQNKPKPSRKKEQINTDTYIREAGHKPKKKKAEKSKKQKLIIQRY